MCARPSSTAWHTVQLEQTGGASAILLSCLLVPAVGCHEPWCSRADFFHTFESRMMMSAEKEWPRTHGHTEEGRSHKPLGLAGRSQAGSAIHRALRGRAGTQSHIQQRSSRVGEDTVATRLTTSTLSSHAHHKGARHRHDGPRPPHRRRSLPLSTPPSSFAVSPSHVPSSQCSAHTRHRSAACTAPPRPRLHCFVSSRRHNCSLLTCEGLAGVV